MPNDDSYALLPFQKFWSHRPRPGDTLTGPGVTGGVVTNIEFGLCNFITPDGTKSFFLWASAACGLHPNITWPSKPDA